MNLRHWASDRTSDAAPTFPAAPRGVGCFVFGAWMVNSMIRRNWDGEAVREAERIGREMFPAHRGAFPWREPGYAVAFGNDGYGQSEETRREVRRLRELCEEAGLDVLGFGVDSDDAYTWALLVRSDEADLLDDLVWQACRESWPDGGTNNQLQRHHAWSVIAAALE